MEASLEILAVDHVRLDRLHNRVQLPGIATTHSRMPSGVSEYRFTGTLCSQLVQIYRCTILLLHAYHIQPMIPDQQRNIYVPNSWILNSANLQSVFSTPHTKLTQLSRCLLAFSVLELLVCLQLSPYQRLDSLLLSWPEICQEILRR